MSHTVMALLQDKNGQAMRRGIPSRTVASNLSSKTSLQIYVSLPMRMYGEGGLPKHLYILFRSLVVTLE
ncbi:hypothetical protein VNO77_37094 [Canavalia gladiata]|uniref:Uncharacterized protein n=1 Tax=Canavalia gladiata TaxID=3824 RepID=A0AAN9K7V7_CANGL